MLHLPASGGVSLGSSLVNSGAKYLVSVLSVISGLNGGVI